MSVVVVVWVCSTGDIVTLSVSFRYEKWVVSYIIIKTKKMTKKMTIKMTIKITMKMTIKMTIRRQ